VGTPPRVIFAENEDSFTWNVVECLPVPRDAVRLVRGRVLAADPAALEGFDVLVVGPGPTDPIRAGLVGLVEEAARRGLPTLGICLGHQALGLCFGARLVRVEPVHGRADPVSFGPSRWFPGQEGVHEAMRYHSLVLTDVPPPLRVVAATVDGLPMAVEHPDLPLAGLQFHPDSHGTPRGREVVRAFFDAVVGRGP